MRKLCISLAIVVAACVTGYAQEDTSNESVDQMAHLAVAPAEKDGLGRAIISVVNNKGDTVFNADVTLESNWGDHMHCESFGGTNHHGAIALLPIHMGELKLVVKAKGYVTSSTPIALSDLARPIQVTLTKK